MAQRLALQVPRDVGPEAELQRDGGVIGQGGVLARRSGGAPVEPEQIVQPLTGKHAVRLNGGPVHPRRAQVLR